MTGFDISSLNLTAEPEEIQPDEYVAPPSGVSEPVPAGTYDATFTDGKFRETGVIAPGKSTCKKNGKDYLAVRFAVKLTESGKFVYGRMDTIPFKFKFNEVEAGRENANEFLDTLMASGLPTPPSGNEEYITALADIVEQEKKVRASVDWQARCNPNSTEYAGCGESIRKMKNFPQNPDGTYNPRVTCTGHHPDGNPPILLAQNEIKRIYPARKGQ